MERFRRDGLEAWANAIVGIGVSAFLVSALRAVGWWDAPALFVSAWFFVASAARSYALRRVFRWLEGLA